MEYTAADELAIRFAKWIGEQSLICFLTASGERKWFKIAFLDENKWTTEELYNLFLQSINK